jgi:F0F1-type ATP synthase assembly protein I
MSTSPRLSDKSQTTKRTPLSAPMVLVVTALDTTWRMFLPTLGGTFGGIWIDSWLQTKPIATIICVTLGTILSFVLIIRQLNSVRKP